MTKTAIVGAVLALLLAGCSKPMASAKVVPDVTYLDRTYAASTNDTYYAVRWALKEVGISVANEDLPNGIITTKWVPVGAATHYIEVFGHPDYGVTNSYHQLEIHISSENGRTMVKVGSRMKTLAANFKSAGVIERRVLDATGDFLRTSEPDVTNLGINE